MVQYSYLKEEISKQGALMNRFFIFLISALLGFSLINPVFADDADTLASMVDPDSYIQNITKVLSYAKKQSKVQVEFPAIIPRPRADRKYFASLDENTAKLNGFSYWINIDATSDCQGVKYCNVGIFTAQKNGKIQVMTDRSNRVITRRIMLADGLDAYFTPGHAMGNFFPSTIQWVDDNVLYTISWNDGIKSQKRAREELIAMANSAKHPGSG